MLKKFNMEECKLINTPIDYRTKLSRIDDGENVNPTIFKSLVRSLILTCTWPDINYGFGFVSRYMESLTVIHMKAPKRILRYIKGISDYILFYSSSNHFKLVGYSDID